MKPVKLFLTSTKKQNSSIYTLPRNVLQLTIPSVLLPLDYKTNEGLASIVYKKTDEWYIKRQRVTASGTTSDNE